MPFGGDSGDDVKSFLTFNLMREPEKAFKKGDAEGGKKETSAYRDEHGTIQFY